MLCTYLHLMLKSRMSGATPLFPLYVFMSSVIISTKYNKKRLSRVVLTFLLEHPLYVYHTVWRAAWQCPAQVCWLLWCLLRGPPCSSSEALCVCVTSALEHSLYMYNDSACIHIPLVTVAQFQLLHNISPPPWSQCHFLTHICCCPQSVQISDLVFAISLSM
jgi:hypothetical protein